MNDLREGVEKYVRFAGSDPTWLSFSAGMDFDGRSWHIRIQAWQEYERDMEIDNYHAMLMSAVRGVVAKSDAKSLTALQVALENYDAARQRR